MLEHVMNEKISLEKVVEKMAHAPAICFKIKNRGFIREGYFADLVGIEKKVWKIKKDNLLYKCNWSPLEGEKLNFKISHTFVNGNLVYENGIVKNKENGMALSFNN